MKKVLIALLACALLSGCATGQIGCTVGVSSITNGEKIISGKTCAIISGMKDINKDDLQYKEFERYIAKALTKKGYAITDNINEADIVVFLTYGIGDPQKHVFSYAVPVFGQTGVSSSQTFGTVQGFGNMATYSGNTTYTPSYGVVGATPMVGEETLYTRYIRLDAFDMKAFRESKKEKRLWTTDMVSTGSSDDLRGVFPVMIAASEQYIGENTQEKKRILITLNDKRVLEIKSDSTGQ